MSQCSFRRIDKALDHRSLDHRSLDHRIVVHCGREPGAAEVSPAKTSSLRSPLLPADPATSNPIRLDLSAPRGARVAGHELVSQARHDVAPRGLDARYLRLAQIISPAAGLRGHRILLLFFLALPHLFGGTAFDSPRDALRSGRQSCEISDPRQFACRAGHQILIAQQEKARMARACSQPTADALSPRPEMTIELPRNEALDKVFDGELIVDSRQLAQVAVLRKDHIPGIANHIDDPPVAGIETAICLYNAR